MVGKLVNYSANKITGEVTIKEWGDGTHGTYAHGIRRTHAKTGCGTALRDTTWRYRCPAINFIGVSVSVQYYGAW